MKTLQIIITHHGGAIDPVKGWACLFTATILAILWVAGSLFYEWKQGRIKSISDWSFSSTCAIVFMVLIDVIWVMIGGTMFFMQFTQP